LLEHPRAFIYYFVILSLTSYEVQGSPGLFFALFSVSRKWLRLNVYIACMKLSTDKWYNIYINKTK